MADRKRTRPTSRDDRRTTRPASGAHAELKTGVRHGAEREEYRSHAGRGWSDDRDARVIDHIRGLAMDAVEHAGSGHPGTAMSLAPAAYLLFQEFLRHDPTAPHWRGRDRFVLSVGHSSLTLYIQLYLSGYGMSLDDLRSYRQWGSRTPGHPEHGHTAGVEATTGPLGQGISAAVGMAMAARRERGLFDPAAADGESVFDHTIWVFASDGDMQEGISHETCALAGHQRLGNLVVLYDDNHISIEGNTEVAMSEDVLRRFEAYGWQVQRVDDGEDVAALRQAFTAARDETERPSIIAARTVIAYPAPHAQNTGAAHGSALGAEEVAAAKEILGLEPGHSFAMPSELLARAREVVERGRKQHAEWSSRVAEWASGARAAEFRRIAARALPPGWVDALPSFEPDPGKGMATRNASGEVLAALASMLPELWGGSADLAGSNNTTMKGEKSFLPWESESASRYGRTLHFGVREHGMAAICNGIALHGALRPYCGTFLVFSDYMRAAVRLAALQHLPVTYVWTHDSIGLGEDGPTHQPIEQLAALRAIPGLAVVRPADANETALAWRAILERHSGVDPDGPVGLCLTRQNVPVLPAPSPDAVARGGYVLAEATDGRPEALLIATGSEVRIALEARERLEADGVATRVVSMPCKEWFFGQSPAYRDAVLPPDVPCRVSVEAGVSQGWQELVGPHGVCVCLEHFGASAPYQVLYQQYGLTPERVAAATQASRAKLGRIKGSTTGN
ncbi:MAG: transketolase [Micromonosporaceae bacterium]|nr:transketolase [Micromonosporaceae bacterium]